MAEKVVAMQTKLAVVLAQWAAGEKVNVAAMAAELGISRQSFYMYRARFAADGLVGLFPRSRRPHSCPWQTPTETEDEIVRLRKQLADDGWDNGAISIRYAMLDAGWDDPPSSATIHRVLRRRGQVVDQPAKRPRSADRRFEFATSNACWQVDAFDWDLADGTGVVVFQVIDDHSRLEVDSYAAPAETGDAAWACWMRAVHSHGVPAMLLSDNHAAYSGARRGWTAQLERNLHAMGVRTITSTPRHPQTCGKDERVHQTLQKWLNAQPPANTLTDLQAQLDRWRTKYGQRHHQGIGGQRPAERWAAADKAPAETADQPEPTLITHPLATEGGKIGVDGHIICLGAEYSRAQFTAVRTGDHVAIFHGQDLTRELTLDRTRRYQPSGTKPGGRRRHRIDPTAKAGPGHRSTTATPAVDEEDVNVQRPQRSEDERR
jgi:transposase-like protein